MDKPKGDSDKEKLAHNRTVPAMDHFHAFHPFLETSRKPSGTIGVSLETEDSPVLWIEFGLSKDEFSELFHVHL
ncbi:hypothetical protein ACNA6I_20340 [Rossellomorea sp. FS2]|uniref:hypothetical protein n=1 Tax=Rossellomorea sp. FS2 TaxID=3391447 RepID=UPI003A4E087F